MQSYLCVDALPSSPEAVRSIGLDIRTRCEVPICDLTILSSAHLSEYLRYHPGVVHTRKCSDLPYLPCTVLRCANEEP